MTHLTAPIAKGRTAELYDWDAGHVLKLSGQFHRTYLSRYRSLVPDGQAELAHWQPVIAAARFDEQIEPERIALLQMVNT